MSISKTYIASTVAFLAFVAQLVGQELPYTQEQIVNALSIIAAIFGFAWTIYQRFACGDVTPLGVKKGSTKKAPKGADTDVE